MSSPDQNKANVKAFYDLAFNQRQPEEAVKQYVGSSYRQHNPVAGAGPEPFIGFVKWISCINGPRAIRSARALDRLTTGLARHFEQSSTTLPVILQPAYQPW